MNDVSWELIIIIIIAGLILFAVLGIFIGTRISADKRRIRELESELSAARKDMETYRVKVNEHFKKTSELFTRMTDSYKAVYLHLAEGAQSLCTNDAAMLKPADSDFMKLPHTGDSKSEKPVQEQKEQAPEHHDILEPRAEAKPVAGPEHHDIREPQAEAKPDTVPEHQEQVRPGKKEAGGQAPEPSAEEQPAFKEKSDAESKKEQEISEPEAQPSTGAR
jgi:uncharacterized protein